MNPTEIIICGALCMFLEGELVEHTYKSSMSECLEIYMSKRIAERNIQPERIQFACGEDATPKAEILKNTYQEKGETTARTRYPACYRVMVMKKA